MTELQFFNPNGDVRVTSNRLPHWQQVGAVYFITFRLADAVPLRLREEWEEERSIWLRLHPKPWDPGTEADYHRKFSGAVERWLDAGHGSCLLRRQDCAITLTARFVILMAIGFC
jgi:hypothetical protein